MAYKRCDDPNRRLDRIFTHGPNCVCPPPVAVYPITKSTVEDEVYRILTRKHETIEELIRG